MKKADIAQREERERDETYLFVRSRMKGAMRGERGSRGEPPPQPRRWPATAERVMGEAAEPPPPPAAAAAPVVALPPAPLPCAVLK